MPDGVGRAGEQLEGRPRWASSSRARRHDRHRTSTTLAIFAALAIAIFGAWQTRSRFAVLRADRYFYELGIVARKHTNPGDRILTPEYPAEPLLYYSRRRVFGNAHDGLIPASGLPESLGPVDIVLIPERPFARGTAPRERLLKLLNEADYPMQMVSTESCGRVWLFDVSGR